MDSAMTGHPQRREFSSAKDRAQHAFSVIIEALDALVAQKEMLGVFAVINTETGEYVTARSLMDATDQFRNRFPDTGGFVHVVGEPLYEALLLEQLEMTDNYESNDYGRRY
jgi:hypothetical protein